MENMEKREAHKDKIRYYLDAMTQKIVDLELLQSTLTAGQIREMEHEILAMDMSLRSNLAGRTPEEAGIAEEYESLLRTKERLLGKSEVKAAA